MKSGEGRAEAVAKNAQRAVGSKAKDSREAAGAASKAKTPAVVAATALAALGGGIALGRGSSVKLRKWKRVLGVPVPKRTAFGSAAAKVGNGTSVAGVAKRVRS